MTGLLGAEEIGLEVVVEELAFGVGLVAKGEEVGHAGVEAAQVGGLHGEEFRPVWSGVEGGELLLDQRKDLADGGPLGFPGEVDGERILVVAGAEPEVVGGDGAELGDDEVRGDVVADLLDGGDGVGAVAEGDEVLGLELLAAGGGEVHAEVGEALEPGAGDAELLGAVFGREAGERVEALGGGAGAEELGADVEGLAGVRFVRVNAGLDPDLGGAVVLPVGEEADAVCGGEDLDEVLAEDVEGEVFVDDLADLVGGLDAEAKAGDEAECAEVDDGAEEGVLVGWEAGVTGEGVELAGVRAGGGDDLDGGDGGGEIAIPDARPVGGGGGAAGDGDVRQRGEIVEGKALGVEPRGEVAVGDAGADGDGGGGAVEGDGSEVREGDLVAVGVGDAVEGVAGAEAFEVEAGGADEGGDV